MITMEYFTGIVVSLIVEFIKKKFGANTFATLASIAVLSLIAAGGFVFIQATSFYEPFVAVAVTAGAFHNYVIRRF